MRALRNKEDDVGGSRGGGRRSTAPTLAPRVSRSRVWLESRDPRIVRASREFGSKDRHSKVSTLKGLRDRRVRLSVATAIQLYDLQDRLGLSQPSKVVDWLLTAAREEIDKLPPLPILPLIQLGEGSRIQWTPSSTSCVVDKEGGGGIQGYTYHASQITPVFASTLHVDEMNMGNNREFLVAHTREATSALLPSPLLPIPAAQLSFCTPGIMGVAPNFVPHVPYPTTSSANLAVDTLHADFGSHRKSPLFSSNKSQHK